MKQQTKQATLISAPQQTALTTALSLKGEIVAYHEVTLRAGNEMVQAAYCCGELLVEVRDVLKAAKTSSFENWIEQFLPFNRSAAYSYIKLATDLGKIENVRSRGQIIASADTISEAKRLISAVLPAAPAKSAPPPVPPAEPVDDPLYFPTEDGPDVNEDADPAPVVEPKPAKNGAEKPHPGPLVEAAISQYVSPLIRALKNIAKVNGDAEGQTWAKAHAACGTVIECLKEMKKGTK